MRTSTNQLYLPPIKTIHYFWTLTGRGGQHEADRCRRTWCTQILASSSSRSPTATSRCYYYTGSDAAAQHILTIGRQALDKASQLDGVPLDFPVHLVVYGNQADVAAALSHESRSVDPNILGQADPPDIVVLDAGDLRGAENEDTVRTS